MSTPMAPRAKIRATITLTFFKIFMFGSLLTPPELHSSRMLATLRCFISATNQSEYHSRVGRLPIPLSSFLLQTQPAGQTRSTLQRPSFPPCLPLLRSQNCREQSRAHDENPAHLLGARNLRDADDDGGRLHVRVAPCQCSQRNR